MRERLLALAASVADYPAPALGRHACPESVDSILHVAFSRLDLHVAPKLLFVFESCIKPAAGTLVKPAFALLVLF